MGKYFMLNDLANKREYPLEIKQKSQVSIATGHRDSTKDIHIKKKTGNNSYFLAEHSHTVYPSLSIV